mmetsp:Transcript_944/g.2623  ORF Transcript_944/g.2623 Transcript_944/m.2623 type:complete len:267 (-) Transcript_944:206-1006(-)
MLFDGVGPFQETVARQHKRAKRLVVQRPACCVDASIDRLASQSAVLRRRAAVVATNLLSFVVAQKLRGGAKIVLMHRLEVLAQLLVHLHHGFFSDLIQAVEDSRKSPETCNNEQTALGSVLKHKLKYKRQNNNGEVHNVKKMRKKAANPETNQHQKMLDEKDRENTDRYPSDNRFGVRKTLASKLFRMMATIRQVVIGLLQALLQAMFEIKYLARQRLDFEHDSSDDKCKIHHEQNQHSVRNVAVMQEMNQALTPGRVFVRRAVRH